MITPETPFLLDFFATLNERGVRYAVMRNSETLPESLGGSDLDILVVDEDFDRSAHIVLETAKNHGGTAIVNRHTRKFHQVMLLGKENECWWGACIDLFNGVSYRDFIPVCADDAVSFRIFKEKGIWTFDDEVAHLIGFSKEWLVNGRVSQRYAVLAKQASQNRRMSVLSPSLANVIAEVLNGRRVSVLWYRFINAVMTAFAKPKSFFQDYCGYQCSKFLRFLRPSGVMVAVLGTDGSGKSTLLNAIIPVLNQAMHNQLTVHHLRPDLLPPLGRLRGVKYEPGHVCTSPHASKPSGFIGSLMRITYLMIDYVLGYWVKVRPRLSKIPTGSWLFDRYAYDMLFDPMRFRISLPYWIVSLFVRLAPKPDKILCLGGEPEKIYARKPETSLEEVWRQVAALKKYCDGNRRAVWIDTTTSIEESKNTALKTIAECMSKRHS